MIMGCSGVSSFLFSVARWWSVSFALQVGRSPLSLLMFWCRKNRVLPCHGKWPKKYVFFPPQDPQEGNQQNMFSDMYTKRSHRSLLTPVLLCVSVSNVTGSMNPDLRRPRSRREVLGAWVKYWSFCICVDWFVTCDVRRSTSSVRYWCTWRKIHESIYYHPFQVNVVSGFKVPGISQS